ARGRCQTKSEARMLLPPICVVCKTKHLFLVTMKFRLATIVYGLTSLLVLSGPASLRAGTALCADEVIQKTIARGQQSQSSAAPDFEYRKLTLTEELDGAGNVKERKEKVY